MSDDEYNRHLGCTAPACHLNTDLTCDESDIPFVRRLPWRTHIQWDHPYNAYVCGVGWGGWSVLNV